MVGTTQHEVLFIVGSRVLGIKTHIQIYFFERILLFYEILVTRQGPPQPKSYLSYENRIQ